MPVKSEIDNCCDKEQSYLLDFIDTDYWRRKTVCCGVLYIGQLGEVMLDKRFIRRCSLSRDQDSPAQIHISESEVSSSLDKEHDNHDVENEEFYAETNKQNMSLIDDNINNNDNETEETFFNKLDKFTATASLITSH